MYHEVQRKIRLWSWLIQGPNNTREDPCSFHIPTLVSTTLRLALLKITSWPSVAPGANTSLFTLSRGRDKLGSLSQKVQVNLTTRLLTGPNWFMLVCPQTDHWQGDGEPELARQWALHILWKHRSSFIHNFNISSLLPNSINWALTMLPGFQSLPLRRSPSGERGRYHCPVIRVQRALQSPVKGS